MQLLEGMYALFINFVPVVVTKILKLKQ